MSPNSGITALRSQSMRSFAVELRTFLFLAATLLWLFTR